MNLGFSEESWNIIQSKLEDRIQYGIDQSLPFILDCTAGNRHIHGKLKTDPAYCSRIIFTDKEPNLRIKPDLICEWKDLPNHFPRDYFGCTILDPNFYSRTGTPAPKWYQVHHGDPHENDGSWWGHPFHTKLQMLRELYDASESILKISPRLCLKWTDSQHSIDSVLTLFSQWNPVFMQRLETGSFKKNTSGSTWWVKLVRR